MDTVLGQLVTLIFYPMAIPSFQCTKLFSPESYSKPNKDNCAFRSQMPIWKKGTRKKIFIQDQSYFYDYE